MAFTAASLADGQLASTKGTIYTSSSVKTIIKSFTVFNTNASSQTVVLYVKRSGSVSRSFFRGVFAQNEFSYVISEGEAITLSDGDEIEGSATNASAVDYVITGATE